MGVEKKYAEKQTAKPSFVNEIHVRYSLDHTIVAKLCTKYKCQIFCMVPFSPLKAFSCNY